MLDAAKGASSVDIDATVEARIEAEKEVVARVEATVRALSADTSPPFESDLPPTPVLSATSEPSPIPAPTPTARPTPTPMPKVLSLQDVVEQTFPSIARITAPNGGGTGFIYDVGPSEAFIVTNDHVVGDADEVEVELNDKTYVGRVLGRDQLLDIAVIAICCGSFQALGLSSNDAVIGQEVMAIGYAHGFRGDPTVTKGVVSALRSSVQSGVNIIQIDAPINRGNSGGPLLSLDGSVIGMNTWKITGLTVEGLGFAIVSSAVIVRAPALAEIDTIEYQGRRFSRRGGPVDVSIGNSWQFLSFINARNFVVGVRVDESSMTPIFAVNGYDELSPEVQVIRLGNLECITSVGNFDEDYYSTDRIGQQGSTFRKSGDNVRFVVIEDTAEVLLNDEVACTIPWEFGREGMITIAGDTGRKYLDFSIWVEEPSPSPTDSSTPLATPTQASLAVPLTADEVLSQADTAMGNLRTFQFDLTHEAGTSELLPGLDVERALGQLEIPSRQIIEFIGLFGDFPIRVKLIAIDGATYLTNPITGSWEVVSARVSPIAFFKPDELVTTVISSITEAVVQGSRDDVYQIAGRVPASALSALVGATLEDAIVEVDLEIRADSFHLTRVRFTGQVAPTDAPSTVRVVNLSHFDEPVMIEAPEINP